MRQVTIRQFHSKMWEEIKNLPLEVTRNNTPILQVLAVADLRGEKILKKIPEPVREAPVSLKQTEGLRGFERQCSIGQLCGKPAVGMREGRWYCKEHL